MYIPKYFAIHELVGPDLYHIHDGSDTLWLTIDERVLITLDKLRARYGRLVVNNWKSGGPRHEAGLRNMDTSTGAALSQHKFGRAADVLFLDGGVTPESVRHDMQTMGLFAEDMRSHPSNELDPFQLINRIEWKVKGEPISWFHFDVGNQRADNGAIKIINV